MHSLYLHVKAQVPHKSNFKPKIRLIDQIIFIGYVLYTKARHIIAYLSLDHALQCYEAIKFF